MGNSAQDPGFLWPPTDGGDGDGDACCSVLVFSPSNPGPLAINVFDDWLDLVTAAGTIEGRKLIQIDPTFDATPTIPTGSHLLNQSEIWAEDVIPAIVVDFVDGCELLECLGFSGGLELVSKSDTPIVPLTDDQVFFIRRAAGILSQAGRAPFLNVGGDGGSPRLDLVDGSLFTGGDPCVGVSGAVAGITIEVDDNGQIGADTLTSVVGSGFIVELESDQVNRGPAFPPKVNRTQPSAATVLYRWRDPVQAPFLTLDATLGVILKPIGWYHALAAAAGNSFALVQANLGCGPIEIDLKDLGVGGTIIIKVAAPSTIDGLASITVGPGGAVGENAVFLKSDGSTKWRTFCCAGDPGA